MSDSAYELNAPMQSILARRQTEAQIALQLRCVRIAATALHIAEQVANGDVDEAIMEFGVLRQTSSPLIAELRLYRGAGVDG